jgi:hypothetical protein
MGYGRTATSSAERNINLIVFVQNTRRSHIFIYATKWLRKIWKIRFKNFKWRYPCVNWFGVLVVAFDLFTVWEISSGRTGISSGSNLWEEIFVWIDVWGLNTEMLPSYWPMFIVGHWQSLTVIDEHCDISGENQFCWRFPSRGLGNEGIPLDWVSYMLTISYPITILTFSLIQYISLRVGKIFLSQR